jgi:excisionase family DNA binding protein
VSVDPLEEIFADVDEHTVRNGFRAFVKLVAKEIARELGTASTSGPAPRFPTLAAARHFGIAPTTLSRAARRGELAASRCGRKWLVCLADVEKWLARSPAQRREGTLDQRVDAFRARGRR